MRRFRPCRRSIPHCLPHHPPTNRRLPKRRPSSRRHRSRPSHERRPCRRRRPTKRHLDAARRRFPPGVGRRCLRSNGCSAHRSYSRDPARRVRDSDWRYRRAPRCNRYLACRPEPGQLAAYPRSTPDRAQREAKRWRMSVHVGRARPSTMTRYRTPNKPRRFVENPCRSEWLKKGVTVADRHKIRPPFAVQRTEARPAAPAARRAPARAALDKRERAGRPTAERGTGTAIVDGGCFDRAATCRIIRIRPCK